MIFILGAVVQVIMSLIAILFGCSIFTTLGFISSIKTLDKVYRLLLGLLGLLLIVAGGYGLYDISSMFTFTG